MATFSSAVDNLANGSDHLPNDSGMAAEVRVALLTGGFDRPYAFGLATALAAKRVLLDVIGSDDVDSPEMHTTPGLTFLNLRGNKETAGLIQRILRIVIYYSRLVRYAAVAKPRVFHILWNNKFQLLDRIVLMLYYRALGKRIVFTAHNVNAGKRDGNNSLYNRLTLRAQYRLSDRIFVHTEQMKQELREDFGVQQDKIIIIPFGLNNSVPNTDLTSRDAKQRLGLKPTDKTILFFGGIRPYKGLEYLAEAFLGLAAARAEYRLIIAGIPKDGYETYLNGILRKIDGSGFGSQVIQRIEFIPDAETELYFKAADVLTLPYTHIFQSGVLFLAYSFGLPVVASDVGSIKEDIIEGRTGFLCRPRDTADLATRIKTYFESDLFRNLETRRRDIIDYASERHSWDVVGTITRNLYKELLGKAL
ncbi:MAG: glycosyltransferase family 4 protein [Candidatus Korobacteraceae bacterium]